MVNQASKSSTPESTQGMQGKAKQAKRSKQWHRDTALHRMIKLAI